MHKRRFIAIGTAVSVFLVVLLFIAAVVPGSGFAQTVPLKTYWHAVRNENFETATPAGEKGATDAGYRFIRVEGYLFPDQKPGTVPLKLYWHAGRNDNFVTATAEGERDALAAGYRFVRVEGYILPTPQQGAVPLKTYWHGGRNDNFATATPDGEKSAVDAGYQFVRIEGYLLTGAQPAAVKIAPLAPAAQIVRPGLAPPVAQKGPPQSPPLAAPGQPFLKEPPAFGRTLVDQPVAEDTRPPGPSPVKVFAASPGPTTVTLQWSETPQATGYLIRRGKELLTARAVTATSYTDRSPAPKTTYAYSVVAIYPQGGPWSPGWSRPVNVTTPPALPPVDFAASRDNFGPLTLKWSPRPDAVAYILSRDGTRIRTSASAYTEQSLPPGAYTYAVAAVYRPAGGAEVLSEWSRPVTTGPPAWGFADMHNHQFSNLGFGGMMVSGKPFDPGGIGAALPHCDFHDGDITNWVHGPWGTRDLIGAAMGQGLRHDVGGYPEFDGWPRWNSMTHQQVYQDWLKRALDGGLKLLVMHAVNNELLCDLVKKAPGRTCSDMEAVYYQLTAAKALERFIDQQYGGTGRGWYRIVRSPREAREAISRGQLAVVLGIEVDNLFGLQSSRTYGDAYVRDQLRRYYDMGVRHVFPIHLTNNAFGGAVVYHDMFNFLNWKLTGSFFEVDGCSQRGIQFKFDFASSAFHSISKLFDPRSPLPAAPGYPNEGQCNTVGLSLLGETLIREMMKLGMIIDVDHMSMRALERTLQIAEEPQNRYPLAAGHTGLLEVSLGDKRSEGQKSSLQLSRIRDLGGLAALITAQGGTDPKHGIAAFGSKVPNNCSHSSKTWAQAYQFAVSTLGGAERAAVAFGTDFNGAAGQPGPRFVNTRYGIEACPEGPRSEKDAQLSSFAVAYPFTLPGMAPLGRNVAGNRTFDINTDGLAHIGLLPDFVQDLRTIGLSDDDLKPLFRSAEAYIRMWEKAEGGPAASSAPLPLYVRPEYAPRTAAGGMATVHVADWKTGAAVPGRVRLDGSDTGSVAAPIAYTYRTGPTGETGLDGRPVTGWLPIGGVIVASGYPNVPFQIPPPILNVKVTRRGTLTNRNLTVTATDALTGAPVTTGTVTINGRTGRLGQAIAYPACTQSERETLDTASGKPKITTRVTQISCRGAVQTPGFNIALFDDGVEE